MAFFEGCQERPVRSRFADSAFRRDFATTYLYLDTRYVGIFRRYWT